MCVCRSTTVCVYMVVTEHVTQSDSVAKLCAFNRFLDNNGTGKQDQTLLFKVKVGLDVLRFRKLCICTFSFILIMPLMTIKDIFKC